MIDKNARVVITGANGFVARALIHRLSEIGCEIRCVARSKKRARALASNYNASLTIADICNEQAMEAAFSDATHVFHLAAAFRNPRLEATEYRRVNLKGTQTVARLAARQRTLERLVHVSTTDIYGELNQIPADEESTCEPQNAYERSKLEGEKWLSGFAREKDLPHTIIRPCTIYGPGDGRLLRFFRMIDRPTTPMPGTANNHHQLAHIDDLTTVLIECATHADALNNTFIYGDQQALTLREINSCIGVHSGRGDNLKLLPVKPTQWLVKSGEYVAQKLNLTLPIHPEEMRFFTEKRVFCTEKIQDALQLRLRWDTNPKAGLIATYDWYKEQQWL